MAAHPRTGQPLREPRYQALAQLLRARIANGHYPVGGLLPAETELCDEFRVSRFTVREALRHLADDGLLLRRQGSGTLVVAREPDRPYRQSLGTLADVHQYAHDTQLTLGPGEAVNAADVPDGLLDGASGSWVHYAGLRTNPPLGLPICTTELYIDARYRDVEQRFGQGVGAIYRLIEDAFGIQVTEIQQEVRAVSLAPEAARRLRQPAGAPALRIVRRYYDAQGQLVEAAVNDHPAERLSYTMRLRRDG